MVDIPRYFYQSFGSNSTSYLPTLIFCSAFACFPLSHASHLPSSLHGLPGVRSHSSVLVIFCDKTCRGSSNDKLTPTHSRLRCTANYQNQHAVRCVAAHLEGFTSPTCTLGTTHPNTRVRSSSLQPLCDPTSFSALLRPLLLSSIIPPPNPHFLTRLCLSRSFSYHQI